MDKPPWVITDATGQRIKSWCLAGATVEEALNEIKSATSNDDVRQIYNSYPLLQKDLKSHCIQRSNEIGSPVVSDVVEPKTDDHGNS